MFCQLKENCVRSLHCGEPILSGRTEAGCPPIAVPAARSFWIDVILLLFAPLSQLFPQHRKETETLTTFRAPVDIIVVNASVILPE